MHSMPYIPFHKNFKNQDLRAKLFLIAAISKIFDTIFN